MIAYASTAQSNRLSLFPFVVGTRFQRTDAYRGAVAVGFQCKGENIGRIA